MVSYERVFYSWIRGLKGSPLRLEVVYGLAIYSLEMQSFQAELGYVK